MMQHLIHNIDSDRLGLLARSPLFPRLKQAELKLAVQLPPPRRYVRHDFGGTVHSVALPVTFTPFASAKPCSARCIFCSETLRHKQAKRLSASLRPGANYRAGLRQALAALLGLPVSLSLSGLEATDDPDWLELVLDEAEAFEAGGGSWGTKVLYTNTNGLAAVNHGERLLPRLRKFGLTRAEVSRHAVDQDANDQIMRFRPGQVIRDKDVFEATVRRMVRDIPVRLVCVIQSGGVSNGEDVLDYLDWAKRLGVRDVVFREFSRLNDDYVPNTTYRRIEQNRVAIESLIDELWPSGQPMHAGFEPRTLVAGYYYWNLRCRWQDALDVTFETSDYGDMKARHGSGVVHKLIYHASGTLNADWDPDQAILMQTGNVPLAV